MTIQWHDDVVNTMLRSPTGDVGTDLRRRATAVQRSAQSRAPRRTGQLAASFSVEPDPSSSAPAFVVISSSDHLWAVESGRRELRPVHARALVWEVGGRSVFSKRARAVSGRPFFAASVEAATS